MSEPIESTNAGDFDEGPPFVFGFGFSGNDAVEMRWEEAAGNHDQFGWTWLHLNMNNEETRAWINTHSEHSLCSEECFAGGGNAPAHDELCKWTGRQSARRQFE